MYLEHFGLRDKPFALGCDLSRYYPAAHQEAQNDLLYSLEERQGIATLIGEPGTGKTTLLKNVLRLLSSDLRGVLVSDVSLAGGSLLKQVLFEIDPTQSADPGLLGALKRAIERAQAMDRVVVLMVDEAQALTDRQLQEVQYLSNLEHRGKSSLQLILTGQPGLEFRLGEQQFKALRQRVAVRSYIEPLSLRHTRGYVELRLQASGAPESDLFVDAAVTELHELSGGIPRLINLIADRALLIGYAEDLAIVDKRIVQRAAEELQLREDTAEELRPAQIPAPVEQRLEAIEQKLDRVLAGMGRAGLLDPEQFPSPTLNKTESSPHPREATEAPSEAESDRASGIVTDFPRRPRPT